MYNTILVPIDMAHEEKANEMIAAAMLHANIDARIILLNVMETPPTWATNYLQDNIMGEHRKEARAELQAIADNMDTKNVDVMVKTGRSSYNTILEVAREENAELIIIGSHDPSVGDYFLGSTAAKVVRHAHCSVFILR